MAEESTQSANTLRIVSLNVHYWKTASFIENQTLVHQFLKEWTPHLVALQEVSNQEHLLHAAGEEYTAFFGQAMCRSFGNAVLASQGPIFEILGQENRVFKPLMARDDDPLFGKEARGSCRFRLKTTLPSLPEVHFYSLHLDHIEEPTRLLQLERLFSFVDASVPHIIAGDFNALCFDDYTPEYLEEIARVRDEGRWEAPHFDVIRAMLDRGYIDVFRRINPDFKDQKVNWAESDCLIVDRPDISDHLPLAADLVLQ